VCRRAQAPGYARRSPPARAIPDYLKTISPRLPDAKPACAGYARHNFKFKHPRPSVASVPIRVLFRHPHSLAAHNRTGYDNTAVAAQYKATHKAQVLSSQFPVLSSRFSVLGSQFSVLSSRFSVLGSQFSVLSSRFSVLGSRFSVLGSRFSVLGSRFSVPGSQFSVLGSRFLVLGSRFSVPGSQFSVLGSRFSVLGSHSSLLTQRQRRRRSPHAPCRVQPRQQRSNDGHGNRLRKQRAVQLEEQRPSE
jgi:hypothetical protein